MFFEDAESKITRSMNPSRSCVLSSFWSSKNAPAVDGIWYNSPVLVFLDVSLYKCRVSHCLLPCKNKKLFYSLPPGCQAQGQSLFRTQKAPHKKQFHEMPHDDRHKIHYYSFPTKMYINSSIRDSWPCTTLSINPLSDFYTSIFRPIGLASIIRTQGSPFL